MESKAVKEWPFPSTSAAADEFKSCVLDGDSSGTLRQVSVNSTSGSASCDCSHFENESMFLCQHVIAAAETHRCLNAVIQYVQNLPLTVRQLSFPRPPRSGLKPNQRDSSSHNRYTVRNGLNFVNMTDPDDATDSVQSDSGGSLRRKWSWILPNKVLTLTFQGLGTRYVLPLR